MDNIQSIRFSGYKSFSDDTLHEIDFTPYVTTFIGKNNCGKSSVIDIIEYVLIFENYVHNNHNINQLDVSFLLNEEHIQSGFSKDTYGGEISGNHFSYGKNFLGKKLFCRLGITGPYGGDKHLQLNSSFFEEENTILEIGRWHTVANSYRHYLNDYSFRRINAERDIVPEKEIKNNKVTFSGEGATNILRRFVNHSDYDEKLVENTLLEELNKIMSPETVFTNIRIQEIQHGNEENVWEVFLEENGKRFALSKSGSGLKTIILILINLYIIPNLKEYKGKKIIYAFEEIENNLHPALQRRIFEYIYNFALHHDTHIFLTTHSHVAINTLFCKDKTKLYHIEKNNGISTIKDVESHLDKVRILDDLDVKASDLFQTNGIIWVEGPSDRVYINHWLKLFCDSKYLEGSNYQFLYYGGKLLAHYSTNDMDNLINVLVTNRNAAIVIDSDKKSQFAKINDTKKRIKTEFKNHNLFCWITKGKEIENYVSANSINHKYRANKPQIDQYELFPDYIKPECSSFQNSKVKFATEIVNFIDDVHADDVLDLKKQIISLYNTIERWNS